MKKKYFVLGPKASLFWDSKSRLKVTSSDKSKPTEYGGPITKKITQGLEGGHIIQLDKPMPQGKEVPPADSDEKPKVNSDPKELKDMNDEELVAFYKENFEVASADIKKFKKLSTDEKVAFLQEEED